MFTFPTGIFYMGDPGFATDCPCSVWCRRLTTCLLYVSPLFGNRVYTRVTHLRSRFQIVCATYWSISKLHASVAELCATVSRSITFAPADPVWRLTPCAALIPSSGTISCHIMPYQMENSQVLTSLTHWWKPFFHLDFNSQGDHQK